MDPESQKNFDRIVALEPAALSEGDITFLRARASYLSADQQAKFAEFLGESDAEDPKPKKSK